MRGGNDKSLQVHCHDHTSMAVAIAMDAVCGGATVIHASVNGLGEIAGRMRAHAMKQPSYYPISRDEFAELVRRVV